MRRRALRWAFSQPFFTHPFHKARLYGPFAHPFFTICCHTFCAITLRRSDAHSPHAASHRAHPRPPHTPVWPRQLALLLKREVARGPRGEGLEQALGNTSRHWLSDGT